VECIEISGRFSLRNSGKESLCLVVCKKLTSFELYFISTIFLFICVCSAYYTCFVKINLLN